MRLFLLGVAIVVSAIFGAAGAGGVIIAKIGGALTTVFMLTTLAAAYKQLVALTPEESTVTAMNGTAKSA